MEISKFNNTLLYSNKNVEKLARKLINESANAVLMEMFEDKCILADHTSGRIYEAEYSFDGDKFVFENFKEEELEDSKTSLKEAIMDYFDGSNVSLAESYEACSSSSNTDVFESSLTEALAGKNMSNVVKYTEIEGINEEIEEVKKTDTFKAYTKRLVESPVDNIKVFNWKDPVVVAILDEDKNLVLNKSMKKKAKKLKSNPEFKKSVCEAAREALSGDTSLLEDLVSENISLVSLDTAELKETIGMSVVGDKKLLENRNKVVSLIETIIEGDEEFSAKKAAAAEDEDVESDAPEASEQDVEAIKKALETAKNKATDEKLIDKIDDLIDSLGESVEAGETNVSALKEAVAILSL